MQRLHATRRQLTGISVAALIATTAPVVPVLAADPVEVSFSPTGAEQSWIVPAGVTDIHVVLIAGRGGNSGGFGHRVSGDLAVTPGATLFVEVGSNGGDTRLAGAPGLGGFNGGANGGGPSGGGGGAGGGATDIRTKTRSDGTSLASRLIVAGAGGGTGGANSRFPITGGGGGVAGSQGFNAPNGGGAGGGATLAAGGGGGAPGGFSGTSGIGGIGGLGQTTSSSGGGGGGGGYFGGGGGGFSDDPNGGGGGGGGGSAFLGSATGTSVDLDATGIPSATITYTPGVTPDPTESPGNDEGVVDADVTVPAAAACVELSTTSISFGTQRFGTEDAAATPRITVTNCSETEESLLAHVSAASGNGATWTPIDEPGSCAAGTLGIDEFHLKINRPANEANPTTFLGPDNKRIADLSGGAHTDLDALLDMPCAGSAGAGQTMGMNIVFVVTEIE